MWRAQWGTTLSGSQWGQHDVAFPVGVCLRTWKSGVSTGNVNLCATLGKWGQYLQILFQVRHSHNLTRCERGPSRLPCDSEQNITNTLGNCTGKEVKGNGSRSFKLDRVDDWRDAGPKATRFRWAICAATNAHHIVHRYKPAYADFSGCLRKT